ncbi:hypothetical protein SERLA73DRAFT_187642 [Serpula lacrymans var. lacrymans S7.3]|uniref:Uncharacterized protein n=2 Tax=Serpula lacrymans var. lacrymans TaxID=341189 RepID=F8Q9T3_SERL3|nr:uncharacterized protein SERLADRAFT_477368 [Serpula lacrymans var. lacrymans S7.9]EGN95338.1 hypothetical protein SERLA73DRAFT_187642 [Serpula lacrymans var. lacrymans S7.3]EGO20870.1 hypothetical protein SERLADRAFT_477368 [Serpula lacrymans var. lacrymans S7.9]
MLNATTKIPTKATALSFHASTQVNMNESEDINNPWSQFLCHVPSAETNVEEDHDRARHMDPH